MLSGAAHVQVRLRDVKDGVPCVETLVEEAIKILGKAELIEDVRQFSHTVALCLANTSRVCREEEGFFFIYGARVEACIRAAANRSSVRARFGRVSSRSMGGVGFRRAAFYVCICRVSKDLGGSGDLRCRGRVRPWGVVYSLGGGGVVSCVVVAAVVGGVLTTFSGETSVVRSRVRERRVNGDKGGELVRIKKGIEEKGDFPCCACCAGGPRGPVTVSRPVRRLPLRHHRLRTDRWVCIGQ